MIESAEAWCFVQDLTRQAAESLRHDELGFPRHFAQGILVETPAAVWSFAYLVERVEFVSVGTNDLVQYLVAVDRGDANVARSYRPKHPVELQILLALADRATLTGKTLSICGEIAADPSVIPCCWGSVLPISAYLSISERRCGHANPGTPGGIARTHGTMRRGGYGR